MVDACARKRTRQLGAIGALAVLDLRKTRQ